MSLRFTVQAIVVGLVVLLVVSGTATGIARLVVLNATNQLADQLLPAREAAGDLAITYYDQQSGKRGFALTGDPAALEPYESGRTEAARLQRELAGLFADDRRGLDLLGTVYMAGVNWQTQVAEPEIAQRRAGPVPEAELQQLTSAGTELFDDVRRRVQALEQHVDEEIAAQLDTIAGVQRMANSAALVTGVLAALVALGAIWLLRRWFTRPLDRLLTDVQTVAGGDYEHPIGRTGPPELVTIGGSVDRMRDSIVEHGERLVGAQHELTLRTEHDRMAKDLHDLIIQRVFGLGLGLTSASRRHPQLQPVVQPLIEETDRIIREVRTVIFDLGRTETTDTLRSQVIDLAEESRRALGFTPTLEFSGPVDTLTSDEVGAEVLAVLREALSNVARHAKASAAQIRLGIGHGALTLTVTDDGRGFDPAAPRGNGIANLQSRAEKLGGHAEVRPGGERGSVVEWSVPL